MRSKADETLVIALFSCIFNLLSRKSDQKAIMSLLTSCRSPAFPNGTTINLPACSPHLSINAERQAGKLRR